MKAAPTSAHPVLARSTWNDNLVPCEEMPEEVHDDLLSLLPLQLDSAEAVDLISTKSKFPVGRSQLSVPTNVSEPGALVRVMLDAVDLDDDARLVRKQHQEVHPLP